MKLRRILGCLFLLVVCGSTAQAGGLPQTIASAPCKVAPVVDGDLSDDAWRGVPVLHCDVSMIRLGTLSAATRPAELRVMNSANTLFIGFRIPDATANDSLNPPVIDMACLAFGKGPQVSPGDDRKIVATGIYRDKSVDIPGKNDKDDPQQDGRGVMVRKDGMVTIEWAVPLDSGDAFDLRARPGDTIGFNLVYFDAFQVPLTKTVVGGLYGPQLDRMEKWGSIKLEADVKVVGESALQSPPWVKELFAKLGGRPASRLRITEVTQVPGTSPPAVKVLASFTYRDPAGGEREAKARLVLPGSVKPPSTTRVPLYFNSGYEMGDGSEGGFLKRGWAVVTPRDLPTNPLIRTVNPDVALLHMVRSLPFVDDTRVMVAGGSAGGYTTLMVAAETFPLAGAAPDVPPINWGYNAAYFFSQLDRMGPGGSGAARIPVAFTVGTMLKGCLDVYGRDFDDPVYAASSPLAQLPTITCPVSVTWSTADMLVPINQVGAQWVQAPEAGKFPAGFTWTPAQLMKGREGRLTLVDLLPKDEFALSTIPTPTGTARLGEKGGIHPKASELPVSRERSWSIVIFDEGAPEPALGHFKYEHNLSRNDFWAMALSGKVAARQLTATKLERLMDRYAGREWLPTRMKHLDLAETECYDVLRGLATYVGSSPENARRFADLYTRLPEARQVLDPEVVKTLSRGDDPR